MRKILILILLVVPFLIFPHKVMSQGAVASSSVPSSSGGGSAVNEAGNFTWTGTHDFSGATAVTQDDEAWIIGDDGDATKQMEFELSSITTGNVSTVTVPQGDFTLSGLGLTQSWSSLNTFTSAGGGIKMNDNVELFVGTTTGPGFQASSLATPDIPMMFTGTESNSWHINEIGDGAFDFNNGSAGTSAQTDPALIIHSANQSTTEYLELRHDQTNGIITAGAGGVGGWRKVVSANTGAATPAEAASQTCYTNTGDADGSSITLPNDPTVGTTFCVFVTAAQTITIAASTGETLYLAVDSCVLNITGNTVGSSLTIVAATGGSGALWMTASTVGTWSCNDA